MAEFLSAEWFDEVREVPTGDVPDGSGAGFRLEQVVTGGPAGDVRYWVTVGGGRIRVTTRADPSRAADATIRVGFWTAVDLATGRRSASDVFRSGEVTFTGDLSRIDAASAACAGLADAVARVRAATTFPADPRQSRPAAR